MNEEYTYLLIITKKDLSLNLNTDYLCLHNDFILKDFQHVIINESLIEFEYLIYTDNVNCTYQNDGMLLLENDVPITNFFKQTSEENIYFINEKNKSEDFIKLEIEEILES